MKDWQAASARHGIETTIPMVNVKLAHWTVVRSAPSIGNGARFWMRCSMCGHEQTEAGTIIRKSQKTGRAACCRGCGAGKTKERKRLKPGTQEAK